MATFVYWAAVGPQRWVPTFVYWAAVGPQRWVPPADAEVISITKGLVSHAHVAGSPSQCPHCAHCPPHPLQMAVPQGFLESLQAVDGEWAVLAGLQEALHVGQEDVAGWEEPCAQPEQLPAPLLTVPVGRGVVSTRAPHQGSTCLPSPPPLSETNMDPPTRQIQIVLLKVWSTTRPQTTHLLITQR